MLEGPSLPPIKAMDEPGTIPQGLSLCGEDHVMRASRIKEAQIVGVSIDEEMLDLTKYQRGYQAGAKIIETTQAMYDIIMNM